MAVIHRRLLVFGIAHAFDIDAHLRAGQRGRQQADHQRQGVALVAADGVQDAFLDARRIRDRVALAVDHPVGGQVFAALGGGPHLAEGRHRGRDIHHHGRSRGRRDCGRNRVGAEQQVRAAPGRHVIGAAIGAVKRNQVFLRRHGDIGRGRTRMVRSARADPGAARFQRLVDGKPRRVLHHQVAHGVVAVHHGGGGGFRHGGDVGGDVDAAGLDAFDVLREAENAVGVEPREVGIDHQPRAVRGVGFGQAKARQRAGNEIA